ncbi:MAG: flavin reductase family protein [Armatimonadota bacterium]
MAKVRFGAKPWLCPMPVVLVGAMVEGAPNYCTVAYCGIVNHQPPMISIALATNHHTTAGIQATGVFSINIPSQDMVAVTDYCGIVSGNITDKSNLFDTFSGSLDDCPLITACPINLECQVIRTLEPSDTETVFIGEILEVHVSEECVTDSQVDIEKVRPFVFTWDSRYWALGPAIGKAWSIGKEYQP